MALTNEQIIQRLKEQFGEQVTNVEAPFGMLTFEVPKELNIEVLRFLYNDQELAFQFLTDLTAVHYPAYKGRELAVVYHLHNLVANCRIRFKVFAPIAQPDVQSATKVFEAANWLEREAYDFFGVNFVGHPNLKRIQNVDEMDYFPLRKEYPVEDQTRIDKDDEMFGRGGSFDFGNRQEDGSPRQIPEMNQYMDAVLDPIIQSPRLPDYVRELNDFLKREQAKRQEFYQNLRDDEKAEFINGEVIHHSPAKEKHTLIRQNLEMIFVRFVRKTKTGVVRTEKSLVQLSRNDFEPDLCFFRKEKAAAFHPDTLFYPAPDFVVEILSTSTASRDRGVKKDDYALHGVKEYWIIDPDRREVEQFLLGDGQFELKEKMSHGTVRCHELQGLEIPLAAIFEEAANEQFLGSI